MSTSVIPGGLVAARDERAVADEAATRIASTLREVIKQRGTASLALSGGNTPRPAYEGLARQTGIDWTKVSIYWIDERAVPPTNARSNYLLAKESLLDRAPIPAENVHRMVGEAPDLEQAARDYEAMLKARLTWKSTATAEFPSFDVAVMGIGDDGHTASLFPGDTTVDVRDRMVLAVAAAPDKGREARLTVSAPVIEQIGVIFVLAVGQAKKEPLQRIWSITGSTAETPSRVLRSAEGKVVWILDSVAAGVG
jgi:6-phosphogluconolactonase